MCELPHWSFQIKWFYHQETTDKKKKNIICTIDLRICSTEDLIFASQGFRSRSPLSSSEERGDRERNPWLAKMQRIYDTGKLVSDKTYDYCSTIFDWTLCCGQNTLTTTWASCCPLSSFPQILLPSTDPTITQPTNSVNHELTINHTPSIWQMNLHGVHGKQFKIDVSVIETYMTTGKGPKFRILEYPLSNNNKTLKEREKEWEREIQLIIWLKAPSKVPSSDTIKDLLYYLA